jgi:hypothetical protein
MQAHDERQPVDGAGSVEQPGFWSRGRARRRARFLRNARELAYRDLGGLVYNLHRFGQRNDALVLAKLSTLGQIDSQLRALETALAEHEPVTVLREAGVTACPRCAAIHSSEDRFCPNCGLPVARHVDLLADLRSVAGAAASPSAGSPATSVSAAPAAGPSPAASTPAPAPAAPATPAAAQPARAAAQPAPAAVPVGRSPVPSTAPTVPSPAPPTEVSSTPSDGEEQTEILHPEAPRP